jgi:serine/threonine protein phosphatase 1
VQVLLGNHDLALLRWLETGPAPDPRDPPHVRYLGDGMGGRETLASYDLDPTGPPDEVHAEARAKIPADHRAFLEARPRHFTAGDCLFVHAGIRPHVPLDAQDPEDLVWIRDDFLDSPVNHGPLVVHGHTVHERVEHHGNRLAIDTGAAYGGPLSAVAIEGRAAFLLAEHGRVPV